MSSEQNPSGERSSTLVTINLVVTTVLAGLAGWSKVQLDQTEVALKGVQATLELREAARKDQEAQRAERESLQKVQLVVYDAVVKSLETADVRRQQVAAALVTSMLDEPLRTSLLNVLRESATPQVQKEVTRTLTAESAFKAEERSAVTVRAAPPPKGFDWEDFDYDIFWCESSGEPAKAVAEKVVAQLRQEGAKGRLRVRLLPDSINSRPGYQHSGYVIRYNTNEDKQAQELKRVGDAVLAGAGQFVPGISGQATPYYLSAFVCPAGH